MSDTNHPPDQNRPLEKNNRAQKSAPKPSRGVRRIPEQSVLYERIVPLALIGLTVLLVVIVLVAVGFLIGVIRF